MTRLRRWKLVLSTSQEEPVVTILELAFSRLETSWKLVKEEIMSKCGLENCVAAVFSYIDDEMDEVLIDSDIEFHEALRVLTKTGNKLQLYVKTFQDSASENNASWLQVSPPPVSQEVETEEFVFLSDRDNGTTPETASDGNQSDPVTRNEFKEEQLEARVLDTTTEPPAWFVSYMNQLQEELTTEITKQVVKRVTKSLAGVRLRPHLNCHKDSSSFSEDDVPFLDDPIHVGIICDNCNRVIQGIRFKCWNCSNYDLCQKCETLPSVHNEEHIFLKIKKPSNPIKLPQKVKKKYLCNKQQLNSQSDVDSVDPSIVPHVLGSIARGNVLSKKDKKVFKMIKKLEKYRTKEQGRNQTHCSPAAILSTPGPYVPNITPGPLKRDRSPSSAHIHCVELMDAHFLEDETIPDGTHMQPGTKFIKKWRVQNTGSKPWTSDTVLKYHWGTMGLVPDGTKVNVPLLEAGEEGTLAVQFTAPLEPGRYQSHWRLYHHGRGFGHRMWCNIEVDQPITLELKCSQEEKKNQVGQIAEVLTSVEKEWKSEPVFKPAVLSHTATPNNTPFGTHPVTPNQIPSTPLNSQPETSNEGNSSSMLSLSSSESDSEFVVVPMPSCFDLSKPFISSTLCVESYLEENTRISTSVESNSSVNLSEDEADSDTKNVSSTSAQEFKLSGKIMEEEKEEGEATLLSQAAHRWSENHDVIVTEDLGTESCSGVLQAPDDVIGNIHLSSAAVDDANKQEGLQKQNTQVDDGFPENNNRGPETSCTKKHKSDKASTLPLKPNSVNSPPEKPVQVLPEALVTGALSAAASVYNTARSVFSGRNELWERPWTPSSPRSPPQPLTPLQQLCEMGFFDQGLNQQLLEKHKGDLSAVISELVNTEDNHWFDHRHVSQSSQHSPIQGSHCTQLEFD
ncbi:next to BRCA1 gene 1 protein-like isoform X1 [Tachypleus tridentatus]|uniref:next to BRCA1 gene 1 protein-like isoform X1 n=1 Tax=Tachypleus tridentatus TaxID=6853 RepID=UPI003FD5F8EC